tara:strand:+ start:843 stop:1100 length:258 start_codon:yes stop_codon:yes gene_type:complete
MNTTNDVLIGIMDATGCSLVVARTLIDRLDEHGGDAMAAHTEYLDAMAEAAAWRDDPDNFDNEKTMEQEAGEAFQDKLDMYRNEY